MFDEMPDHFLASNTRARASNNTTSTTSFSLHNANFQPNFDASSYFIHNPQLQLLHLQQQATRNDTKGGSVANSIMPECVVAPWSNEEVLALLKIISSLDNPWFPPEFTWENVSRKMAEVGFKRDAKKCKEKFEEETRSFNNNSNNNKLGQNYRLFGELEELYNSNGSGEYTNGHDHEHNPPRKELLSSLTRKNQSPCIDEEDGDGDEDEKEVENIGQDDEEESMDDSEKTEENTKKVVRKRRRHEKFEMFKGFCEKIVNKMIAQQEELHCKILQDMVKRDEEKIVREEAWKRQEIDRIAQEMEVRAHEQAIVGDRQTKILGFLKKFSSSNNVESQLSMGVGEALGNNVMVKVPNVDSMSTSSSILSQGSISATQLTSSCATTLQKCNLPISLSKDNLAPKSPTRLESPKLGLPISSSSLLQTSESPNQLFVFDHTSTDAVSQVMEFKSLENNNNSKSSVGSIVKDDTGRRWPRDEVLALINIRCSLFNNIGDNNQDKENFSKGPLWERISTKMMDLGYNRSAKRCKEKWENINKYFRKTKDLNKKRSIDSRTCPYFHQLSHLYNQQGPLHGQSDHPSSLGGSGLPDNHSMPSLGAQGGSNSTSNVANTVNVIASQANEVTLVQMPTGFDFEFQ